MSEPITVVGGGLGGAMTALLLAKKGQQVRVLEGRPDFRKEEHQDVDGNRLANAVKRSINLALSYRGICALKAAGVWDKLNSSGTLIPMRGRVIHMLNGSIVFQPYGIGDQAIYSVSRTDLNRLLLDELDQLPNCDMRFGFQTTDINRQGVVTTRSSNGEHKFPSRFVIGADGVYSASRRSLQKLARVDLSITHITSGYKELSMPSKLGLKRARGEHVDPEEKDDFILPQWDGLHIWPRHDHQLMLIALPNPDYTFTCTLFAPFDGPNGVASLKEEGEILNLFQRHFPDVIPLVPDLCEQFRTAPHSPLLSVHCRPWNFENKLVILGDAGQYPQRS